MKPSLPKSLLCVLAVAGTVSSTQANLLVRESFSYSGTNNSTMNGVVTTGTGLQGNWTVTNALPSGGASSSLYQTSGLSFGSNYGTTSGGSIRQNVTFSGSNAQTTATVQLDMTTTITGDVWGSYLVSYTNIANASGGFALEGISPASSGTGTYFTSSMITNAVAASRQVQAGYDTVAGTAGTVPVVTGTTYLYISKYTNVGTTLSGGSPGTATTWVFNETGYNSWVTTGGALEANMATYAFGIRTDSATSGQFNFDDNGFLTFKTDAPNFNGNNVQVLYDEVLYGTTLGDVYKAVPEPTATALAFGAGVSFLLFRRKRVA